jgi:small glutamine-rich tetratricopeptide repeat-containing protein alpha
MSEKQQKLVLSIIDFLKQSIENGTVKQDDQESLEVAIQCIGEAFGVDPSDEAQVQRLTVKPATLQTIFDVFLKTRDRVGTGNAGAASSTSAPSGPKQISAEDKAAAEKLKVEGNSQMSAKKYDDAIASYTRAVELDPTNAVFYSNRAAAHISKQDYNSAIADAEKAIEVDSKFVRAYSRLGHAHYSLGDYSLAAAAYRRGLAVDPNNASLKSDLQSAEARVDEASGVEEVRSTSRSPPAGAGGMGGMADMLRNMGMGGGGGGMPDIASMMQNPQLMAMAQQMMANGGLERMMSNPAVANMMNQMQNGGEMPSMSELMSDPSLRELASQFGVGAGGGAGR